MVVVDVKTAFFNAKLEREVIMILNKDCTKILCELRPQWKSFIRTGHKTQGTMLVQLDLALYGLQECSRLWYDKLAALLTGAGFTTSTVDDGLFYKTDSTGKRITLCVHVDDMLITKFRV